VQSAVCAIPFKRLEELGAQIPSLQRHMFRLLSQEIALDQGLIQLLSTHSAEERLATFIQSLCQRFAVRGISQHQLRLPMSRSDIAGFLGLRLETLSRLLGRWQKEGLIQIKHRDLSLLKPDAIAAIARS